MRLSHKGAASGEPPIADCAPHGQGPVRPSRGNRASRPTELTSGQIGSLELTTTNSHLSGFVRQPPMDARATSEPEWLSVLVLCRRARMDPRQFRPHLYAGATPVVVWRSLAGCFIGLSDPDTSLGAAARLTARVSGVGCVGLANHPAPGGRRGSCAGPAPSISAGIRRGRSRCAPVAPGQLSRRRRPISLPSRSR
jgi:hypothetical protein